jgi:oxygen-independent coproporphyrinogen-3 oxidase
MCNNKLDIEKLENKWHINFKSYFKSTLDSLQEMADDGLLKISNKKLTISSSGRLLARSICMQFDRYLQEKNQQRFSRII